MKLSSKHTQTVDDAIDAYVDWLEKRTKVWDAYRAWTASCSAEATLAFWAYVAALDREEAAAAVYADRITRVGELL